MHLRILHIASGDLWAGAENLVFELSRQQHAREGVTIAAIVLNEGELSGRLTQIGVPTFVIAETDLTFVQLVWKIWRVSRAFKPNVIHTHRHKENIIGGVLSAVLHGTVSLRTVHGGPEFESTSIISRFLNRIDLLVARHLQRGSVFVSNSLRDRLKNHFPLKRTYVISNGVDLHRLESRARQPVFNLELQGRFRVCFAARLSSVKRVDIFLAAAKIIIDNGLGDIHFYLLGDGPELQVCRDYVTQEQLSNRIHILGFRRDTPEILSEMNCLLITSDHEGCPMIMIESMVLGVVIVGRSVGGIAETLCDGKYGILVDSDNPADFSTAIRSLYSSGRVSGALRDAGREYAKAQFNIEATNTQYQELYQSILREK